MNDDRAGIRAGNRPPRWPTTAVANAAVIEGSLRDPEQFAVLFDRHAPRIHRHLARRVGRQVADGLLDETFLAGMCCC